MQPALHPSHPSHVNYSSLLWTGLAFAAGQALPAQYLYTQQTGLITGPTVRTEGCLMADLDDDSDLDIVFTNGFVL